MQFVLLLSGSQLARGTETDDHDNKYEIVSPRPSMFEGKKNSLPPAGPVIKCFVTPLNSKVEKTAKKSFALRRLAHKFPAVSRSTT